MKVPAQIITYDDEEILIDHNGDKIPLRQIYLDFNALASEVERLRLAARCGQTGLMYAEPMLSMLHGLRERLDEETQRHLFDTLLQVRRSSKDLRAALEGKDS